MLNFWIHDALPVFTLDTPLKKKACVYLPAAVNMVDVICNTHDLKEERTNVL